MKRDAVTNPPLKVFTAVSIVTAPITHRPTAPAARSPMKSCGYDVASCAWVRRWLIAVVMAVQATNSSRTAMAIPL
jgi:hypothetical protein